MAQSFGGNHTEEKLQKLEEYLKIYATALKNKNFKLSYFDGFAGTAEIDVGSAGPVPMFADLNLTIKGSAYRALSVEPPFDKYHFVELRKNKLFELERDLKSAFPQHTDRMKFTHGDANDAALSFCSSLNRKSERAVMFLDPFGNQVSWKTLEAIAETEAIDLWFLFPAGLGVNRLLWRNGRISKDHSDSLNRILGTDEWQSVAYSTETQTNLFGEETEETTKLATAPSMTEFMIKRMKTIFKGGVLNEWLPLGSNAQHMYSLLFAWANPSEKAKLASKLARAVLKKKRI